MGGRQPKTKEKAARVTALREKMRRQKPANPQVAKLAETLAALPEQARQALLELLRPPK